MSIACYRWSETDQKTKARIMHRSSADIEKITALVKPIIDNVKNNGDQALIEYAQKFDNASLTSIKVSEEEFERAERSIDDDLKKAIQRCAGNVKKFHAEQMRRIEDRWMIEIEPGIWAGEQVTPIESVGLYVPRGKGAFPSAMYMLCIPAVMAGVNEIAVVTPPTSEGLADDASLYTARLCGVDNVYKAGGAQGIAALAYGTESIPAVKKVLGPGSIYVAAAKRELSGIIDPGMPAGPSEAIVLCDETADPHNSCLDILNEAEHGMDSASLLITNHAPLCDYIKSNIDEYIDKLPQPQRNICAKVMKNYGGIILTESIEESIAIANEYAPEHLLLKVKNPEEILPKLKHAGEILIGENTPIALGNYGIGVNHVLPTSGWANTYSCTSIWDFLKRISLAYADKQGFENLKDHVTTMTNYENFPAHGNALNERKLFDSEE